MFGALISLISQLFNRKRNFQELAEALDSYQNDKESTGKQLRLEAAFYDAFKKRASAKLISQVASMEWGPRESMRVFGESSHNVRCNFTTHKLEIIRLNKILGKWLPLFQFFSGVIIQTAGVTLLFIGTFIWYRLIVEIYFTGIIEIQDLSLVLFANIFQMVGVGSLATVLGVLFVYIGWKGIGGMESDTRAFTLKRMHCQPDDPA